MLLVSIAWQQCCNKYLNYSIYFSEYYLNTQILRLVFKYVLQVPVFKYLTIEFNNHPVTKYALSLITVHILGLRDFAELSEDQRHMSKIF